VADHGEVFTPAWMVEAMLDLVRSESERIDSRFLEPACGSGNFKRRAPEANRYCGFTPSYLALDAGSTGFAT
jgi:type I restriction-modification system DNA methylase subunit